MKTLVILYMIYLSWGTAGQGYVSILEMSRYLRRSKTQMRSDLFFLADNGLVEIERRFSDAGAQKLFVCLSDAGDEYLMQNFEAATSEYHKHVAETIALINDAAKEASHAPRKLSRKERQQIAAGQKELF